jgi:3-oxoacyl-[acyl-carrier-protein] synthase-3
MSKHAVSGEDIGYVIFCTQSPDYLLPTSACLIQQRLGLPTSTGAVDINLGCSGYVYGLGLAKGLLETGQASSVLLLTADTYSKFINRGDKSVRTLFGDAGTATLLKGAEDQDASRLDAFVYGTDGRGGPNLIVPTSGARRPRTPESAALKRDATGSIRSDDNLFMNGPEIFSFTMEAVPQLVQRVLQRASLTMEQIDHVIFHQANRYMLEHLRKKLRISTDKFVVSFEMYGNTVSSTIPIAFGELLRSGKARPGQRVMVVGFGVGYSWAGGVVTV